MNTSAEVVGAQALVRIALLACCAVFFLQGSAWAQNAEPKSVEVAPGVVLAYQETGSGPPLILVHGSSADYRAWRPQVEQLSRKYRVISYSRRYNFPNRNAPADGYSARGDAADLFGLIQALKLEHAIVVGHSYGAFATLFLLIDHPEAVRAAVLAEPPAISLLREYHRSALVGRAMEREVQANMVAPMTAAFRSGDRVAGMRAFYDYVAGPGLYSRLPEPVREYGLENSAEWQVVLTRGTFFPDIDAARVRRVRTPVLLLAGSESNAFLLMIHETLAKLLPNSRQVVLDGAPHPMFATHAEASNKAVLDFLARH